VPLAGNNPACQRRPIPRMVVALRGGACRLGFGLRPAACACSWPVRGYRPRLRWA